MKFTLLHGAMIAALSVSYQAQAYNCQSLAEWDSGSVYQTNDEIQSKGIAYKAAYWTQGNDPATNSDPWESWKKIDPCFVDGGDPGHPTTPTDPIQLSFVSPVQNAEIPEGSLIQLLVDTKGSKEKISHVNYFYLIHGSRVHIVHHYVEPFQSDWIAFEGATAIIAEATDVKGNIKTSQVDIFVQPQLELPPPMVGLVSPKGNEKVTAGDTLLVAADAQDYDGFITQVDFFINNKLVATDTTAPYEYSWTAIAGDHIFSATATDDTSLSTSTGDTKLSVAAQTGSGGCADATPYVAGTQYAAGDFASLNNQKYRCDVAGWCSSKSAWAYEPGKGLYWQDAWTAQGTCSTPANVALTTPTDGTIVLAGSTVSLAADANDPDGSVTQVEFFANNSSLGIDTQAPYTAQWAATTVGTNQIKAVATDNENNQSESVANVTVSDKDLIVSLTSPNAIKPVGLGKAVTIGAEATSLTSTVKHVEFTVNGSVVATDTTAPYSTNWTPTAIGNFSIGAQAVDVAGNRALAAATSLKVVEQTEKTHKLIGYWHNFVNGAGCPMRLADMSDAWDIIDIAFAENDRGSDGTVHFHLYSGDIYSDCPALDPTQFKQDMAALQAKGKKFVLSLGGAEGTITLNTDQDEAKFISSLTNIIKEWGFDGLDVDLESGSNLLHGSQIQARLGRALLEIEKNMGGDMYLTMAPEHPYVHGGMIAYSGIWGAYIPVINDTRSTLDLLHVQLYNNGGLPNPYLAGSAAEGSVDMMVAQSKMLIEGFELADGTFFEPLRDDQVAIGLPSGPSSANSGQAPTQNILDALDCLTKGLKCGTVKPTYNYPNFAGVMTWSINWDQHDGYNFSKPVGDKLTQMNAK